MEDNDIFKNLKSIFSWLWKPAKTHEEKIVKRYDMLISLCVVFMLGYVCVYVLNFDRKASINVTTVPNVVATNPNYNPAFYVTPDSELHPLYTTNALNDGEFYIGEIVGVKYFGIFGLVREKTIGTSGFNYSVRYENSEHDLMNDQFHAWELYRPMPGTVPISVLRQ